MDLTDVSRALRRFWLLALAVFAITVAAGYVAATRGSTRFDATATIAVAPAPGVDGSAESVRYVLPVIIETVGSQSFFSRLGDEIPADLLDRVDVSAENDVDTGIVRITAQGPDRAAVSDVANAATAQIIEQFGSSGASDAILVELIDEAPVGARAGSDNRASIMLASVVLGVILAAGAAVAAQRSVRSLDPVTRIRNELGVPVLAVLPTVPELKVDDVDLDKLLASGPAPVVEAFQGLRTRLEVQLRDDDSILAVTAWQPNEGRTTIAAALGVMLAAVGREVVVIDTDLRDPRLHERLGEPFAAGLSEFDQVGRGPLATPTARPRLSLVAAGVAKTHPSQILAVALPAALQEIVQKTPEAVVLIDAPPLRPARQGSHWVQLPPETATVLRAARRVVLVIDAATSHLTELAAAVERLRGDDVVVVGVVLNRRRRSVWRR